ncbi:MAG: hypothetical protein FIO02_02375 [Nitrosopumilales archaeon]|nr:hypothetical protein [Nitrosopumilales archaeon]
MGVLNNKNHYRLFSLPYTQNPTPTIMAKTIRPTKIPAISFMRKTITAIITIRAIIATIISTIAFPKPIAALAFGTKQLNKCLGITPESVAVRYLSQGELISIAVSHS